MAPQFAAGCFGDAMRRQQFHRVRRYSEVLRDVLGDRRSEPLACRGVAIACFRDNDEPLGAGSGVRRAKCGYASLAYAGNVAGDVLYFVRIEIAARLEDDVLDAPGKEDFTVRTIAAIAGIEPPGRGPRGEKRSRGCRIVKIAAGGGGAAEPQLAFDAIGGVFTRGVHDTNLVIG